MMRNFLCVVLLVFSAQVWAGAAGKVIHIAGTVSAQRPDGALRVLNLNSEVLAGDVISTEKNSIVRILFTDGGRLTLRPETRIDLEAYHFEEAKPEQDNMAFSMLKGGLRAVTGKVGKRSTPEAYKGKVTSATIGIRGTRFGMLLCRNKVEENEATCLDMLRAVKDGQPLKEGFYFDVTEGAIEVLNKAGARVFTAIAYGYVSDENTLAEPLSEDPGLIFVLPSELSDHPGVRGVPGFSSAAACVVQ